jgi:hypothetical protein
MLIGSLSLYFVATLFGVCALFRRPLCGLLSVLLMLPAFGLYFFSLFYSYLREKTFPLGDPYGFISFLGNLFVPTFLFLAYKYRNLLGFAYLVAFVGFLATLFVPALFTFSLQEYPLWSSSPFCISQLSFCPNGGLSSLPQAYLREAPKKTCLFSGLCAFG